MIELPSGKPVSSVFVLDASHVWSASLGAGSEVPVDGQPLSYALLHGVVSRSTDGGATWKSVAVPGDWGGTQPVLAFADPRHGFLLLSGPRGGGASVVFASADGGATWQRVGGADHLGSVFGASDSMTLWAGNEGDARRTATDSPQDGGRSSTARTGP